MTPPPEGAGTSVRTTRTAVAGRALTDRFKCQVDPDGVIDPEERGF